VRIGEGIQPVHEPFRIYLSQRILADGEARLPASFCDGDATGPVVTDISAPLGPRPGGRASFKNAITAPDVRPSAQARRSLLHKPAEPQLRGIVTEFPASNLVTQMRIR
jgi:hypothetical protein